MFYNSQQFTPQVNQTIGLIPMGNARNGSYSDPDYVVLGQVTDIKRKYFYVQAGWRRNLRFERNTNHYAPTASDDCSAQYAIFASYEDAEAAIRAKDEWEDIRFYVDVHRAGNIPDLIHAMYELLPGKGDGR